MKSRRAWYVSAIVMVLITLPYLYAWSAGGSKAVFGGFLLNPVDGNSYLAKMYEGWLGNWQFTLPFTADPGPGTYLFLYYIFLGHLARLLGISLIWMYHVARLVGAAVLLAALCWFFHQFLPDEKQAFKAFWAAALLGGLGWIAAPFIHELPPDLWVAEAYPFLAAYTNPHFPLSLALLLGILGTSVGPTKWKRWLLICGATLLLAILQPFGVIIAGLLVIGNAVWEFFATRQTRWQPVAAIILGGLPMLFYQFWVIQTVPALMSWNAQNVTPSPGLAAFILGFSPMLILATYGSWLVVHRNAPKERWLVLWALIGILLVIVPTSLQRRFLFGLFIPLCGLAAIGLDALWTIRPRMAKWLVPAVYAVSVPSVMIVILTGISAAGTLNQMVYLTTGETKAMGWIRQNTTPKALILAAPQTGSWIPGQTGRRVLYGHPFETVSASSQEKLVDNLFKSPPNNLPLALKELNINYVFFGPREREIQEGNAYSNLPIAWQGDGVTIYSVQ